MVKGEQQSSGSGSAPGQGGAGGGTAGQKTPIIKAGKIMFAVLKTSVNSDYPGPVLARIVSGPYKGTRLIGNLTTFSGGGVGPAQKVMLTFSRMQLKHYSSSISINAVAIDPDTARTALSSYTNNHYLLRYGSLFASAFAEGFGQAYLQSGKVVQSDGLSRRVDHPDLNTSGKLYVALGNVGNKFGNQLNQVFNRQPTVHVYSGTSLGILFTQDVASPS
jgi:intracellular multiplication protein IcmE